MALLDLFKKIILSNIGIFGKPEDIKSIPKMRDNRNTFYNLCVQVEAHGCFLMAHGGA